MKSKKGKTYEEMVARMKAGAKAERERLESLREQNKSETLQIRLEPDLMCKILAIAERKGIKHSTLVRSWIARMVDHELSPQGTAYRVNESPVPETINEELNREMYGLLLNIQAAVTKLSEDRVEKTKTKTPISESKKRK